MTRFRRTLGAAVALIVTAQPITAEATAPPQPAVDTPVVRVHSGTLQGVIGDGVRRFDGIPFAAPPVGANRWRAPRPVKPWPGIRSAAAPGPNCHQAPDDPVPGPQSEDCLYLNVTTPANRSTEPRPVMVWLHGGGFFQGAGADHDATRLARIGDVVVVTPNYRLGTFGFLGHPGLPDSGSYGLLDQQAALRWVRRNAAAFGGDPRNVTLSGESAGAMGTCAHLTSPSAAGLFHRAIMQSGTCMTEWPSYTGRGDGIGPFTERAEQVAKGAKYAAKLGCTNVACLRAKPATALLGEMKDHGPAYGTRVVPTHPAAAVRVGRFHRVPVVVGANRDEARVSLVGAIQHPLTDTEYAELIANDYGATATPKVLRAYPPAEDDNGRRYADLTTDRAWAYTTRQAQRALGARTTVYAYEFADRDAPVFSKMPPSPFPYGAYHGAEVMYFFGINGEKPTFTPAQRQLGTDMIRYWAQFARTGSPNGNGLPTWRRYDKTEPVLSLAPGAGGIKPVDYNHEHHLAFWIGLHG